MPNKEPTYTTWATKTLADNKPTADKPTADKPTPMMTAEFKKAWLKYKAMNPGKNLRLVDFANGWKAAMKTINA